jgi:hypothetical protein
MFPKCDSEHIFVEEYFCVFKIPEKYYYTLFSSCLVHFIHLPCLFPGVFDLFILL